MQEVYTSQRKDNTIWQPRPRPRAGNRIPAPHHGQAGQSEEQSKAVVAAGGKAPVDQSARMTTLNGVPAVEMDEGFDRAWRRVGVALDRTGFTVEDRDRSRACTLCATWANPNGSQEEGLLRQHVQLQAEAKPAKYQIAVRSEGNKSQAVVLGDNGQP
jgi:outer membrane protein assembly factor BamC